MSRSIFDPSITASPCRWPCSDFKHVHNEDLPANFAAWADMDPENVNIISKSSTHLEVWDD